MAGTRMKGLPNAGQTCYFNVALQCLLYCPNLTNYFLVDHATDINRKVKGASAIAEAYGELVRSYWTSPSPANPLPVHLAFVKACRFKANTQHDAHEALVCMLDKLHCGLSRMKPPPDTAVVTQPGLVLAPWVDSLKNTTSVVMEVFRGQVETRTEGPGVSTISYDHFTSVSLPVHDPLWNLGLCFEKHMDDEVLSDFRLDNGGLTSVTQSKRFTYLPRILVVHLKRFDNTSAKLAKYVDYTVELDLGRHAVPGIEHHYQLFAVCLHRGTESSGHYTACAEVKGQWYAMDDDNVTRVQNIANIIQKDAYMLFYKRL